MENSLWKHMLSGGLLTVLLLPGCVIRPLPSSRAHAPPASVPPTAQTIPANSNDTLNLTPGPDGRTATGVLPDTASGRILVSLEARIEGPPGAFEQEVQVTLSAGPDGTGTVLRTSILLLDEWSPQQFFIGGPVQLPPGPASLTFTAPADFTGRIVLRQCSLRTVPPGSQTTILERRAYNGQSPRASWRNRCATRMEEGRKAPARIQVRDAAGAPLAGVMVELTLLQPSLRIAARLPAGTGPEALLPGGSLVNAVVSLPAASWDDLSTDDSRPAGTSPPSLLPMDGGVLLPFAVSRNQPLALPALRADEKLILLKQHIEDELKPFAGQAMNWDLSDGLASQAGALDALAPDAVSQLLATARKAAPAARIHLHDFGILEGGARKLEDFLQRAIELQGSGFRPDGLSVTLEAFRTPPPPLEIIARLDRLASANLPLRIAPLGFVGEFDPAVARTAAADLLLVIFGQPAVQSIVITGADQPPWSEVLKNPPAPLKEWMAGMKYKARTDSTGKTLFRVPAGRYAVSASTPRGLQRSELVVGQGAGGSLEIRVQAPPKPALPNVPAPK